LPPIVLDGPSFPMILNYSYIPGPGI
jgi:hypothetical protein